MTIDAKGLVAGRIASKVAKALINDESVTVLNAEAIVIVGGKEAILEKYKRRVDAAVKSNPNFGPKYSRVPDRLFRRMVRNMLPTKKSAKERLIKKLHVYNKVPEELAKEKMLTFEEHKCNERHSSMTLKELCLLLGGRW
jgi:large subunit ribosomal protein L13